jgi:hypothetical protein
MFIKKDDEFEDGLNYYDSSNGSIYRKGLYNVTEYINISNADLVTFKKYKKDNTGTIIIKFGGDTVCIDGVSSMEWSKIQETFINGNKEYFDLSKFRKENKASLDNHSNQLNPNNKKYK